jgi:methionyl-tRNA formyltransferase
MRIVFMGSPEFALPALQALIDPDHELICVYTKPPKPTGRGKKMHPTPVELMAREHGLAIRNPANLKQENMPAELDLIIVAAYGVILPKSVLDSPKFGCINIHPSLLPRWRGAAPVARALLAGDRETGVTIMLMNESLDAGDILAAKKIPILHSDNKTSLDDRLSKLGAEMLLPTAEDWVREQIKPSKQEESQACYADKINNAEQRIDWQNSAESISQKIRAFAMQPGAFFKIRGNIIKILQADAKLYEHSHTPGTIINPEAHIACGQGIIIPKLLQRAGKKILSIEEFLRGTPLKQGEILD